MNFNLEKLSVKIARAYNRWLIAHSKNPRPTSYPYLSGDGFRKLADHVYEGDFPNFRPDQIKKGDRIFLGDSNIRKFLKNIHPKISEEYTLISHNGDEKIDENLIKLIDDRILKWYGINVVVSHPRIIPIPLGIENLHYYVLGIPKIFNYIRKQNIFKKDRIFYAFTVGTNPIKRQEAYNYLSRFPLAETLKGDWLTFQPYLRLLSQYKFVASPEGSSVEGHRAWDSLYLRATPIVTKSETVDYFSSLGIPYWVINSWRDLDGITERDLNEKYKQLWEGFDESKLFIDFWRRKIISLS